jgi:hypothetical protein
MVMIEIGGLAGFYGGLFCGFFLGSKLEKNKRRL